MPQKLSLEMENILFITCTRIGDAVLTTGVLSEIEKQYPHAKVTIAVGPLPAPLFFDYPLLEKLIIFSKEPYKRHWLKLWKQVRHTSWDWVIDLRGSCVSYGLRVKKRSIWSPTRLQKTQHKVLQVAACVNMPNASPSLWVSNERFKKIGILLKDEGGGYLGVAPFANWCGKQWPSQSFFELLTQFSGKNLFARVILFGSGEEKKEIMLLRDQLAKEVGMTRVIPFVDGELADVASALRHCKVFVGNDSGVMHMACALKVPTLGLFGPSNEKVYGPWPMKEGGGGNTVVRIPLSYEALKSTPHFSHHSQDCYMKDLTVETVWEALDAMWKKG